MRKTEYKLLLGKNMNRTAFGMVGCCHGMYCENREYYMFGIKNIIGLSVLKKWGYDLY